MEYEKKGYLNSEFRLFHLSDDVPKEYEYHYHDFHKITIFISGKVQYFIEGKCYNLKPYDVVLVNRNDMHRISVRSGSAYERIIVYISPGFIDAYKNENYDLGFCFEKVKSERSNVLRMQGMKKSSLFQTIMKLEQSFKEIDREYAAELYRQVLFLEFMIHLNRRAMKNRLEFFDTTLYNPKVTALIEYINEHLTENLDIDALANQFYLSKYYMMRLFKDETGFTIGNYIGNKRLLLARELLGDASSITEVCFQCGFRNYSTFSRAYKKMFDESPRVRKNLSIQ